MNSFNPYFLPKQNSQLIFFTPLQPHACSSIHIVFGCSYVPIVVLRRCCSCFSSCPLSALSPRTSFGTGAMQ